MLPNVYTECTCSSYRMYIHNVYTCVTQCITCVTQCILKYTLCDKLIYISLHIVIHWVTCQYTFCDIAYTLGNIHVTECIYLT